MTEWLSLPVNERKRGGPRLSIRLEPGGDDGGSDWAILYLHGFGSSHSGEKAEFFRRKALEAGIPICSFDFRGHGDSGGGMLELTLTRNLEDVALVRAELSARDWPRLVILGSSLGGLTGLWSSALGPEGVEAGLYIAPALGLDETFAKWLGDEGVERWREEGVLEVENELGSWDLGWGFLEDLRSHPDRLLARSLRTPALLLQGKLDDRVPWRRVADLAGACARFGVELELFEEGDHRLADRKETLWESMLAFLAKRGLDTT